MTSEDAEKLNYIKIIDYHRTKDSLSQNMAIIDHATAEIKAVKEVFDYRTVLITNFAFLFRAIMYHVVLVSLVLEPGICIFMLLMIELLYMVLIAINFLKLKHLISIHLFLSKISQSMFLTLFHCISLIIFFKNGPNSVI